jgi:hypothetical protein
MKIVQNVKQENCWLNKQLESFLERTGPIKKNQLSKLVWYSIDIASKNVLKTKIVEWENKDFKIDFSWEDIYSYKTYPKRKILHNVLLIETYLLLRNKIWADLYNTFFDGEISIPVMESNFAAGNIILQPDITVYRGNTIICIEMDMWTESYQILKEKETTYKKFAAKYWDKYKITVVFSSFTKRNEKIKEYWIFKDIDVRYVNLDDYLPFLKY